MDEKTEYEKWLASRPPMIRELARKYPTGRYRMNNDAPYGLTCPGTLVTLIGYTEGGDVIVVVAPQDMLPEAIEHSNGLLRPQGRDHSEIANQPIKAYVDPQYITPLNASKE